MKIFSKEAIGSCLTKAAKPAGVFVTISGLFSDFVKPYVNFVPYFLLASLLIAIVMWLFFGLRYREGAGKALDRVLESAAGPIFGLAILSTLFWVIMLPVFWLTPGDGVLSSSIPSVATWQQTLLGRFDRLESKIDNHFDAVMGKLDSLDVNSGIIHNPKSPTDYYHNARIEELTGNALGAKQSYEKYFATDLQYLDPFLSYTDIVRSLEGPSSASEILGQLRSKLPSNPSAHLAFALSKKEKEDRDFLLTKIGHQFPFYGPVYYYILLFNSVDSEGRVTLANQERAAHALRKLDSLEKKDGFSNYFLDKELLSQNLATIKRLRSGLTASSQKIDFAMSIFSPDLVELDINPKEMVNSISYRIDGIGAFQNTGNSEVQVEGKFYPQSSINKGLSLGKHLIEAKYKDSEGEESTAEKFYFEVRQVNIIFNSNKYVRSEKEVEYTVRAYYYKVNTQDAVLQYSMDTELFDKESPVDNAWTNITLTNPSLGKHTIHAKLKFPNGEVSEASFLTFSIQS